MPPDRGLVKKGKEGIFLQLAHQCFSISYYSGSLSVELGFRPPSSMAFWGFLRWILDFKAHGSGFHQQKISHIPESEFLCMYDLLQTLQFLWVAWIQISSGLKEFKALIVGPLRLILVSFLWISIWEHLFINSNVTCVYVLFFRVQKRG